MPFIARATCVAPIGWFKARSRLPGAACPDTCPGTRIVPRAVAAKASVETAGSRLLSCRHDDAAAE